MCVLHLFIDFFGLPDGNRMNECLTTLQLKINRLLVSSGIYIKSKNKVCINKKYITL